MEKITDAMIDEMIQMCRHAKALGVKQFSIEPDAVIEFAREIQALRSSVPERSAQYFDLLERGWDECAQRIENMPAVYEAMKAANPYRSGK